MRPDIDGAGVASAPISGCVGHRAATIAAWRSIHQPAAAVAVVAAAPRRLAGTPASRAIGCGGSSTAVPGTSGARKNGAQYATGTAAAKNRAASRSVAPDHRDQTLAADSESARGAIPRYPGQCADHGSHGRSRRARSVLGPAAIRGSSLAGHIREYAPRRLLPQDRPVRRHTRGILRPRP
jgi:hypothetical protein